MNNITGFKTLVGSLYNKFNKASVTGKLNLKKLYLIDIINELLYDCPTCYNENTFRKLRELSIMLENIDKDICIYREQNSIYTNIVGCKDCNPNNSALQIINTAPIIDNPTPIEPEPEPEIPIPIGCDLGLTIRVFENITIPILEYQEIDKCFISTGQSDPLNIKILELPINGVLMYNEELVEVGQIIPLIDNTITYTTVIGEDDIIRFSVSAENYPDLYSEGNTFTINYL